LPGALSDVAVGERGAWVPLARSPCVGCASASASWTVRPRRLVAPDVRGFALVYHLELRQFPHNVCRFNLSEAQLRAVLDQWVVGMPLEYQEVRWVPQEARLTVLEGPPLEPGELTMGRGWRAAQRRGTDITEQALGAARTRVEQQHQQRLQPQPGGANPAAGTAGAPAAAPATAASAGSEPAHGASQPAPDAFTLGVQIAALLGANPLELLEAWRTVASSSPELSPSAALARAEAELASAEARRR